MRFSLSGETVIGPRLILLRSQRRSVNLTIAVARSVERRVFRVVRVSRRWEKVLDTTPFSVLFDVSVEHISVWVSRPVGLFLFSQLSLT